LTESSIFPAIRSVAALTAASGALIIPQVAFGQAVADRTLSDVKVDSVGGCTTLTVSFNIRVQVLSHFPDSGRELHVRIRPLDADQLQTFRESLRAPANVPDLRAIEYEGDNPSGPVLSLLFTRDKRFEVKPAADPHAIAIRVAQPGSSLQCAGVAGVGTPGPAPSQPAAPEIAIPSGLYVVNLLSKPNSLGDLTPGQASALSGKIVYETLFERDSLQWHRLRLGFFASKEEADASRKALAGQFPEAFVVKVSADERAQGVASRMETREPVATPPPPVSEASEGQVADAAKLVADAETAIRERRLDQAIQFLTNALAYPENTNSPRALELLGLTRERKNQMAHARAEYEEYLRRYPSGEASDRVRQRLAAITSSAASPGEALRQASGGRPPTAWTWGARGSFSQFYFRDQSKTKFVDASRPSTDPDVDNSINLNQLMTTADLTLSGGNDRRQLQFRAAGAYTFNFRKQSRDIKSLTALYVDYSDSSVNSAVRVGRQTRNSSGVLGRFDGVLVGWQARPKVRLNAVAGFPVLSSRQTHILKDRHFYGASIDIGGRRSPLQTSVYWFDQRAKGGFVDRRSIGLETRVLRSRFNGFAIVDYDVKYKKLNLGLLTLNYNFPDSSNFSLTADYRQSPLLTTNNAVIGQINTLTMEPIFDLRGLRQFFTDKEIYQLAQDRTITTKSVTVSYSRPLSKKLQANLDVTVTHTGGAPATPARTGTQEVAAIPSTGTEYYYGAQVVGTGLIWENDIYIVSGRYSDTQRSNTYTADINARVQLSGKLRLSPRLRYGYRKDKLVDSTFRQLQPTMRINYYPIQHTEVEVEFGADLSRQRDVIDGSRSTTTENGFVLSVGYRIDF